MDIKEHIARTGLILLGLLIGFITLELFSRYYLENTIVQSGVRDYLDTDKNFIKYFQLSDVIVFEPIGYTQVNQRPSQGLLYDRVLGITSDMHKRVLIVGDSIVHRGTFPKLLQSMLDARRGDKSFDIISYGVESYNTAQEAAYIQRHWSTLKPDILVLQFTLNDFAYSPVVVEINGRITYLAAQREPLYEPLSFLFKTSSLYRFVAYKTLLGEAKFDKNDWENRINTVRTALTNLKLLSEAHHTPFVVVVFPFFKNQQPEPEYSSILSLLEEISVPYINLLPVFESHGGLSSFGGLENGIKDVIHPSEASQQIIANALYEYIDRLGILKSNLGSN